MPNSDEIEPSVKLIEFPLSDGSAIRLCRCRCGKFPYPAAFDEVEFMDSNPGAVWSLKLECVCGNSTARHTGASASVCGDAAAEWDSRFGVNSSESEENNAV